MMQPREDVLQIDQSADPVKKESKQRMQQTDNSLIRKFNEYIRRMYAKKYTGIKRYNWEPTANSHETRRLKTKMFY